MGLTEQEFDDKVTEEVNEQLRQLRAERLLDRLLPPASTSSMTPRILTKEDCLQLFRATGVPTSGSLVGIYHWAADLGKAYYNLETNFDPESLAFLDAYDC